MVRTHVGAKERQLRAQRAVVRKREVQKPANIVPPGGASRPPQSRLGSSSRALARCILFGSGGTKVRIGFARCLNFLHRDVCGGAVIRKSPLNTVLDTHWHGFCMIWLEDGARTDGQDPAQRLRPEHQ